MAWVDHTGTILSPNSLVTIKKDIYTVFEINIYIRLFEILELYNIMERSLSHYQPKTETLSSLSSFRKTETLSSFRIPFLADSLLCLSSKLYYLINKTIKVTLS